MQPTSLVGWKGPIEIRLFAVATAADPHGGGFDPEAVQWHYIVTAPNGIRKPGRARGRAAAQMRANAAADLVAAEYAACQALYQERGGGRDG